MTNATILFERFKTQGESLVEATVSEGWTESEVIDFKTASEGTAPMRPDDRKNLAKALSGYTNADGGIILWGVLADKTTSEELDVAKELRPIKKLHQFVTDLYTQTAQVISPAIVGVEHLEIPRASNPDEGFVVTYVPRSDGEPKMATAKDQHRFYVRAGSSFIKMTPSMLADRYQRRPQPKLEFYWSLAAKGESGSALDTVGDNFTAIFTVGIRNVGRGVARFPALKMSYGKRISRDTYGLDGNGGDGLTRTPTESATGYPLTSFYTGGSHIVIYPGTEHAVTKFSTTFDVHQTILDLTFEFEVHCDGHSDRGEATIPGDVLYKLCF